MRVAILYDAGSDEWSPQDVAAVVAFLVAVMEAILRLLQFVHAPYYALFIVGPIANMVEITLARRRQAAPA